MGLPASADAELTELGEENREDAFGLERWNPEENLRVPNALDDEVRLKVEHRLEERSELI